MVEGMRFDAGDAAEKIDPTEPSELDSIGGGEKLPPELADEDEKGIREPDEEDL